MAGVKKAITAKEASSLLEIPNIGKAMVEDFEILGITEPLHLKGKDAYQLYVSLCDKTRAYHDPCVLDTFMAAVHFMDGKGSKPWWDLRVFRAAFAFNKNIFFQEILWL
ncbi:MAG: mitomycin resistance protein [Proteobacteria bacterium]|nr:MAG: mitomycin resistance protein [Pseudomonadota bacterium]